METDVKSYEELLHDLYYNPKSPIAFGSFTAIKKYLKRNNQFLNDNIIKQWLSEQTTHSLHLDGKKSFKRNKVFVMRIDENWQCDLVDMQMFAKDNDGIKYLFTCIDVFSKFAWVIPLFNKSAQTVNEAFRTILSKRKPEKIQFDLGKEFNNKYFKSILAEHEIIHFAAENTSLKCVVVERFHRTLKSKMYKYFTAFKTNRYIDVLQSFVDGYNSSYHTAIKMSPANVCKSNQRNVFYNLYRKDLSPKVITLRDFQPGDWVRVFEIHNIFRKGYKQRWSDELFAVYNVIERPKALMYEQIDYKKRKINRRYYGAELQRVSNKAKQRISTLVAKRDTKEGEEQLVTLQGYPSMEAKWIPSERLY